MKEETRAHTLMRQLFNRCIGIVPDQDLQECIYFFDHNELGIALMEIAGSIVMGKIVVPENIKSLLLELYEELMDEDDSHSWREMDLKGKIESICTG